MKADYLLRSNAIFTGKQKKPFAGGVAVKGNRILKVLDDKEVMCCEAENILDFGKKMIMAGFVDSHVHYFMGAISASEHMCLEIANSTSEKHCIEIMKEYALNHPNEKRLLGLGWFPANWGDDMLPSKHSLDEAFPDKPVYLISADIHTFWMNTKALEESGIVADYKPRSGSIGIDENGELNGLLFEPDAFASAMVKVQEFDIESMIEINKEFLRVIAKAGVTSISEMSADPYDDAVLKKYLSIKEMEQQGSLTARMHIYTELAGHTDFSIAQEWKKILWSEKVRLNGVKGFVDGVASTYTGLLLEPYSDRPDTNGIGVPNIPQRELEPCIIAANKAGFPVRLHCIADGSTRMALDMYEASVKQNGYHGLSNCIEHIENIHPEDIPRFKSLGVIPSMQPYHLTLDYMEKPRRIGNLRCRWEWAHRSLLNSGANLAFGTDYPVVDFNPYPSIYAAVTRLDDEGNPASKNPEESITLAEALYAYTAGSAKAYGRDDIGILEEGNLADIIVVSQNLFEIDPMEIKDCETIMTMFDGKIVYSKDV